MLISSLLTGFLFQLVVSASSGAPQVTLNGNQVVTGQTVSSVDQFLGLPFATPPLGNLRFRRPQPFNGTYENFQATQFSATCVGIDPDGITALLKYLTDPLVPILDQIAPVIGSLINSVDNSEDCLYLNVYRPSNVPSDAALPVMVWIYGGAFLFGAGSEYDGSKYVTSSVQMGQPVILVTLNYRLGPYGFLGGTGIQAEGEGNAGIADQRLALKWVQDHIADFGGDPTKVTIFGESAGAMSVFTQMVVNDGDNSYKDGQLFRAAIMQSGSATTCGSITDPLPQQLYTRFANEAGCGNLANDAATLACLRSADASTLDNAFNSYDLLQGFGVVPMFLGFSPRADGTLITQPTMELLTEGKISNVPYIIGNNEDEGTIFSFLFDTLDNSDWDNFMNKYLYNATAAEKQEISQAYPNDWSLGSPYRTGLFNALTFEFKRFSSVLNDILFTLGRRKLLNSTSNSKAWVFFADTLHDLVPFLGTFHANDIVWQWFVDLGPYQVYRQYWIAFANNLDPNVGSGLPNWPQYTATAKEMLQIGLNGYNGVTYDTFREDAVNLCLSIYYALAL